MQLLALGLGGRVESAEVGEFGRSQLTVTETSADGMVRVSVDAQGVPTAGFGRIDATTVTAQRNGQMVARFRW